MAHAAQTAFLHHVKALFPERFVKGRVLDCGSLDVNGSARSMFEQAQYTGVDFRHGRGVDIRARVHDLPFGNGYFDVVLSTEMLEHDEFWEQSLRNMVRMLAHSGLLILTMATEGRPEHGTLACPDLGETPGDGVWGSSPSYYRNLTARDLSQALGPLDSTFRPWACEVNEDHCDLYFWGIKS